MGAAHKGRNDVVQLLVDHGADLALRDIGSRDSIHALAGVTWQAIDYADGLVRVGVQSAIRASARRPRCCARLMMERGLPVPAEGRTLASICIDRSLQVDLRRGVHVDCFQGQSRAALGTSLALVMTAAPAGRPTTQIPRAAPAPAARGPASRTASAPDHAVQ